MEISGKVELSIPEYHELIAYKEAVLKRTPVAIYSEYKQTLFFDTIDSGIEELVNSTKFLENFIKENMPNCYQENSDHEDKVERIKAKRKWWQI